MDTTHFPQTHDPQRANYYTPLLPDPSQPADYPSGQRRPVKNLAISILSALVLCAVIVVILDPTKTVVQKQVVNNNNKVGTTSKDDLQKYPAPSRGVAQGVSEKSFRQFSSGSGYPWTNAMLSWQRTSYHFQPQKNWMNGLFVLLN